MIEKSDLSGVNFPLVLILPLLILSLLVLRKIHLQTYNAQDPQALAHSAQKKKRANLLVSAFENPFILPSNEDFMRSLSSPNNEPDTKSSFSSPLSSILRLTELLRKLPPITYKHFKKSRVLSCCHIFTFEFYILHQALL